MKMAHSYVSSFILAFSFTAAECIFVSENLYPKVVVLSRMGGSKSVPSLCYLKGSTAADKSCFISPKWLCCLSKSKAFWTVKVCWEYLTKQKDDQRTVL